MFGNPVLRTLLGGTMLAPILACGRSSLSAAESRSAAEAGDSNHFDAARVGASPTGGAAQLTPGWYLVAIDTPVRTYLDYVEIRKTGSWSPATDGWPMLARWEKQTTVRGLRFAPFVPGETLSVSQIQALLPVTAPAARVLDISAAPYRAAVSPADATASIRAALTDASTLADLDHPVDVLVPPGTYDYAEVLDVAANVRLRGAGGVLRATRPASAAVHLAGDRSGALFLTLTSPAVARSAAAAASGIWVGPRFPNGGPVHDTLVIGNDVRQPMGAHVFGRQEIGGTWAFNYVHDGFADSFHHTGESSFCQVVANRASGSATRGDDLYAFVGYASDGDPVHHCSCIANWGRDGRARGLAAVGAGFIDFEHNDIARSQAAGIYIARESSYNTFGSFEITVRGNQIAMSNLNSTHDGLLAYADAPAETAPSRSFGLIPNAVRNLVVKDNRFLDIAIGTGHGYGIEVRDSCEGGEVSGNTVHGATVPGVVVSGRRFATSANAFASP